MDFILDHSLVLYLPLYELDGSSLMSKDAYGHLATVTGALWTPRGRSFDGTDDYISTPKNAVWADNQQGTMGLWAKSPLYPIIFCKPTGIPLDEFGIGSGGGTTVRYRTYLNDGATSDILDTPIGSVNTTDWFHIVLTSDGSTIKIYINGINQTLTIDTGANNGTWFGDVVTYADTLIFGAVIRNGSVASAMNGGIGEVRIYNRALTALEIQQNYLATKWRYQ